MHRRSICVSFQVLSSLLTDLLNLKFVRSRVKFPNVRSLQMHQAPFATEKLFAIVQMRLVVSLLAMSPHSAPVMFHALEAILQGMPVLLAVFAFGNGRPKTRVDVNRLLRSSLCLITV